MFLQKRKAGVRFLPFDFEFFFGLHSSPAPQPRNPKKRVLTQLDTCVIVELFTILK